MTRAAATGLKHDPAPRVPGSRAHRTRSSWFVQARDTRHVRSAPSNRPRVPCPRQPSPLGLARCAPERPPHDADRPHRDRGNALAVEIHLRHWSGMKRECGIGRSERRSNGSAPTCGDDEHEQHETSVQHQWHHHLLMGARSASRSQTSERSQKRSMTQLRRGSSTGAPRSGAGLRLDRGDRLLIPRERLLRRLAIAGVAGLVHLLEEQAQLLACERERLDAVRR